MHKPVAAPSLTRTLDALNASHLPLAGGKGASLGAMLQAGLPVPEGFAVLTHAYWGFVAHNGLEDAVRELVEDVAPGDPQTLADAAPCRLERLR